MLRHLSFLAPLMVSVSSFASVVVYTDREHPPVNATDGTGVVWLDETERLQQNMFGALAKEPARAARQAQSVIHSADWSQKHASLTQAYQGLIRAWQLGLEKYPAVVFDDRDVVYGTVDVAIAQSYRKGKTAGEGQL